MQYCFRFPGFRVKALTFSYDDGISQDIRLIDLFQKHGLRATFNLNSGLLGEQKNHRRLQAEEVRALYDRDGVEVAMHSLTHPHLEWQQRPAILHEIMEDRQRLEGLFGRPIAGFAYPYGTYNDTVVDVLRTCGVKYARTVINTGDFSVPQDWLRMPATCHHDDPHLFDLADRFLALSDAPDMRWATRLSVFYVWGHSYEFDERANWQRIEEFAAKMGGHADVWYATNGEIFDYINALSRLEVAADGSSCYNPTAQPICFYVEDRPYTVAPGQTLRVQ